MTTGFYAKSSFEMKFKPIFHCDAKPFVLGPRLGLNPTIFALGIPTPTPTASRWNIGGAKFSRWPCRFHVVCASFSALATQTLANANADSGGIQA